MSPTIAGLILSIPLSWASGQLWIGVALAQDRPVDDARGDPHARRSSRAPTNWRRNSRGPDTTARTDFGRSWRTRNSAQAHEFFLPEAGRRRRGEIDVEDAVATAKLNDARSLDEACAWLKPKERLAVLNDRALISLLARLPASAEPREAAADADREDLAARDVRRGASDRTTGKATAPRQIRRHGRSRRPAPRKPRAFAPPRRTRNWSPSRSPMKISARRSPSTSPQASRRARRLGAARPPAPNSPRMPSGAPG